MGDMVKFTINGNAASVETDPAMPILWVVREKLGLTGTKFGCGIKAINHNRMDAAVAVPGDLHHGWGLTSRTGPGCRGHRP